MNTFQLECFLSVANHLNFAHAAQERNVTQPAISHQIRSLESELKVQLFHRSTRSVSLTHEGELFLPEASRLIILFRSLQTKFGPSPKRGFVPIQVACTSETLMGLLPDVLYRLASEEPNVHPILRNVPTPQIAQNIHDGDADIVLSMHESTLQDADITFTELTKTPLVCVCDDTHPIGELSSVDVDALREHFLIFFRPSFCDSGVATLQLELSQGKPTDEIFFCDDITGALTLARAGFGVMVLPQIFLSGIPSAMRVIPFSDKPPLSFGVYAKKHCSPLVRSLIRLLQERFAVQA